MKNIINKALEYLEYERYYNYRVHVGDVKVLEMDIENECLNTYTYSEFSKMLLSEYFNRLSLENVIEMNSCHEQCAREIEKFYEVKLGLNKIIEEK